MAGIQASGFIDSETEDRRSITVGAKVEYRSLCGQIFKDATVVEIRAIAPATGGEIKVDSILEYQDGDGVDLATISVEIKQGEYKWGYWPQVRLP